MLQCFVPIVFSVNVFRGEHEGNKITWVQNAVLPLNSSVTLHPSFLHTDLPSQYVTLVFVFLRYLLPTL